MVRGYLLAKSASSLGIQAGKTEFGKRLRDITIKEGSSWYLLSPLVCICLRVVVRSYEILHVDTRILHVLTRILFSIPGRT